MKAKTVTFHRHPKKLQEKRSKLLYRLMYGELTEEQKELTRIEIRKVTDCIREYKNIVEERCKLQRELGNSDIILSEEERLIKQDRIRWLNEEEKRWE